MEEDLELAEILLKKNLLDQQQLVECMRAQATEVENGKSLSDILLEKGIVTAAQLTEARAQLGKAAEGTQSLTCAACGTSYRVKVKEGMRYRCRKCKGVLAESKSASKTGKMQAVKPAPPPPAEVELPAGPPANASAITAEISRALAEMESRMSDTREAQPSSTKSEKTTFEVNEATSSTGIPPSLTLSPEAPAEVREASRDPENDFGHFVLVRLAGRGAMGEVWQAWDKGSDRFVALKILQKRGDDDLKRFRREAEIASSLDHPNIVKVFEVGEINERPYIAMEYIEGATLRSRPGDHRQRLEYAAAVCDALDYAHQNNIVHRDIKPGNIMLSGDGMVKVADFGLARPMSSSMRLRRIGEGVFGTPGYMSPEQARGKVDEVDARSDVFSLGATLYFLLTGNEPFPGGDSLGMIQKIIQEDPPPPRQTDETIPEEVELIVLKALQKQKLKRYGSASEFADDIRKFLQGVPLDLKRPAVPQVITRKTSSRKWQVVTLLLLLCIGGTVAALLWLEREGHLKTLWETDRDRQEMTLRKEIAELERQAKDLLRAFETSALEKPLTSADRAAGVKPVLELLPRIAEKGKAVQLAYKADMVRGWAHFALGEFEKADEALARVLAASRTADPEIYALRARVLLRAVHESVRLGTQDAKWRNGALSMFREIRESGKGSAADQALAPIAILLLENKVDKCVPQADGALSRELPAVYRAALLGIKADALAALGRKQEAAEAYHACGAADKSDYSARAAEARWQAEAAAALDLKDPAGMANLDAGIGAASDALAIRPESPAPALMRARLYSRKALAQAAQGVDPSESIDKAATDFASVATSTLGAPSALEGAVLMSRSLAARADLLRQGGQDPLPDLSEAIRLIGEAVKLRTDDPVLLSDRADLYCRQGKFKMASDTAGGIAAYRSAIEDLTAAIQLRKQAPFFLARGRIHMTLFQQALAANERELALKDLEQALLNLDAALQGLSTDAQAAIELGEAQLAHARLSSNPKPDLDAALNSFNAAIRNRSESARAYEGRGFAYFELAEHLKSADRKPMLEYAQAAKDWKEAGQRDPALQEKLAPWVDKVEKLIKEMEPQ